MISGLIGVIHLGPLPGDPNYRGDGLRPVLERAQADAKAWREGGADALIVENFGSTPFVKGTARHRLPPHQVAAMTLAVQSLQPFGLPLGVNCLRNDIMAALGIASVTNAAFVRVNVHTGAYVTDQGLIEGEASESLRYRNHIGASQVQIFADCLVKHAHPLVPIDAAAATRDCLGRGLADGVVVTGTATGAPVNVEILKLVRGAAGNAAVLLGSGVTPAAADALGPLANAAIVGTWAKVNGDVRNPVDVGRVRELVAAWRGKFRRA